MEAIITYNPKSQKLGETYYDSILTYEVLMDICQRITGQSNFRVVKENGAYNKGRLLTVFYNGVKNYVTLSETSINGRNSSLQSVPTAINLFYADIAPQKKLYYYFLPFTGNPFTDYHIFIYRLMITSGICFLNINMYHEPLSPYRTIDEMVDDRQQNRSANSSNNSSYISKTKDKIQIYAKVFGANKYESTILAFASSKITDRPIDLFNICEQDLKTLPQSSVSTLMGLGNILIHDTSITLDKRQFLAELDRPILRSPIYLYNLLSRVGYKKCALCDCEVPEIIQGAHIWNVADIAKSTALDDDVKYEHATNGHNGLWLCQNHHKLFDSNILFIGNDGNIRISDNISPLSDKFIKDITKVQSLSDDIFSDPFKYYLNMRNANVGSINNFHLITA